MENNVTFTARFFSFSRKLVVTDSRSNKKQTFTMSLTSVNAWAEATRSNGHTVNLTISRSV